MSITPKKCKPPEKSGGLVNERSKKMDNIISIEDVEQAKKEVAEAKKHYNDLYNAFILQVYKKVFGDAEHVICRRTGEKGKLIPSKEGLTAFDFFPLKKNGELSKQRSVYDCVYGYNLLKLENDLAKRFQGVE